MHCSSKMTHRIPETFKKYIIQRIINPGLYWMTKNNNGLNKKEMQQFEQLLSKHVEKIDNVEEISIGKIIAVKNEAGFYRGLVTDIFYRNNKITYLILLIDHGEMVETTQKKMYSIKNKELITKNPYAIKVSISGIQPVLLDLEYDKHFLKGIFQKRVHSAWSPSAYKYVQDLVAKNPCVFVRPLHINGRNICGEIYFIQEFDKAPVSLGQKLCDNGFAVFSNNVVSRFSSEFNSKGVKIDDIEKKIPEAALSEDLQPKEIIKSVCQLDKGKNGNSDIILTDLTKTTIDLSLQQSLQCKVAAVQNNSSLKNAVENKNANSSLILYSNPYNTSILRKHLLSTLPHTSYNCFEKKNFPKSEKISPPLVLHNSKVSIFRVVQRTMELYEKQKQLSRVCCQN